MMDEVELREEQEQAKLDLLRRAVSAIEESGGGKWVEVSLEGRSCAINASRAIAVKEGLTGSTIRINCHNGYEFVVDRIGDNPASIGNWMLAVES